VAIAEGGLWLMVRKEVKLPPMNRKRKKSEHRRQFNPFTTWRRSKILETIATNTISSMRK